MHRLDYDLIAPGAGYRAACLCGQWRWQGVIRNPQDAAETREARVAHASHELKSD
jgi:hypothetical protein